jgi:hypothetical protein
MRIIDWSLGIAQHLLADASRWLCFRNSFLSTPRFPREGGRMARWTLFDSRPACHPGDNGWASAANARVYDRHFKNPLILLDSLASFRNFVSIIG